MPTRVTPNKTPKGAPLHVTAARSESLPAQVFEELVDTSSPLGIFYQKRSSGPWPLLSFAQPFAFFARGSAQFSLHTAGGGRAPVLDSYVFALVPGGGILEVTGDSAIADGVCFIPSRALIHAVETNYKIDVQGRLRRVTKTTVLPRTNWLNELMHRYVFERVIAGQHGNTATSFLEAEIVKEIYYRTFIVDQPQHPFAAETPASDGERGFALRKALDFIEVNLFRDVSVREIAARSGVSDSTLLREFHRHLKKSPLAYLLDRRLAEANVLLQSKRYSIGQVSDMVGYENLSAFSGAFKKHFGRSPSASTKDKSGASGAPAPASPPSRGARSKSPRLKPGKRHRKPS